MYRVLDESECSSVGIKVESKLTEQDFEVLLPYLETSIQAVGPINLLFDMTPLDGQKLMECWNDVIPKLRRVGNIPRVAVVGTVGPSPTQDSGEEPGQPTEVHWFSPGQVDEAWMWLKSRKNGC